MGEGNTLGQRPNVETIRQVAQTGQMGDGIIFSSSIPSVGVQYLASQVVRRYNRKCEHR